MRTSRLWLALLVGTTGCALGRVRQVDVQPLGPYSDLEAARVVVDGEGPVRDALRQSVAKSLSTCAHLRPAEPGEEAYEVHVSVTDEAGQQIFAPALGAVWNAETTFGMSALAFGSGKLGFDGTVSAHGVEVANVRWEGTGTPEELAPEAGQEAGTALAHSMELRKDDWVQRLAGDERVFLAPTPLVMTPGEFTFQYDELLVTHSAIGLPHRLEVDVWAGGVPIPSLGGSLAVLPHQVNAQGGAGILYAGFFDVGVKLKLVDEGAVIPGIAISYDMLDVYGDSLGVSGGIQVSDNIVAHAGIDGGATNLQFNVFGLTAGKHFGNTQLIGGAYLVDNHHFLPQSANFAMVSGNLNEGPGHVDASATPSAGSSGVAILPAQIVPFAAIEQTLGPHATLAAEVFPRSPWYESVATTGVKWRFGFSHPWGPLAINRLRITLDLAAAWSYFSTSPTKGFIAPIPYLGAGFYVM